MNIFLPPLAIDETGDVFGRAVHGTRLTNLVTQVDQPLAI